MGNLLKIAAQYKDKIVAVGEFGLGKWLLFLQNFYMEHLNVFELGFELSSVIHP